MKKTLFLSLSAIVLLAISCEKENNPVETPTTERLSFNAYVVEKDITKTSYAGETTFSWVGNECLSMQLIKVSDGTTRDRWIFYNETEAGGTDAKFVSSGSLDPATWGLGEYAFYPIPGNSNCPSYCKSWNVGSVITNKTAKGLVVSNDFKSSISNPLQFVPMIGYKDAEDNFAFHTAVGILKVTVSDIDSRLAKVRLYSEGQKLNGTYTLTGDGDSAYIAMTTSSTASEYIIDATYTDWVDDTELPFYFPVPVGILNSGFKIQLLDSDANVLRTVVAPNAVTIERNKISEITKKIALPAEDFSATITVAGTSTAIQATVDITKDATSVKVVLAASESDGLSLIDSEDSSVVEFTSDNSLDIPMTNISTSGTAYLVARTYSGTTAKMSSSTAAYVLTATDASDIIGQYAPISGYGLDENYSSDILTNGDNTLTLAVSNDPAKGNIMITEFAGYCWDVSESTHSTLVSDFSEFTDGAPVYGTYGDGIKYGGTNGALFSNTTSQVFYTDKSGYSHYITEKNSNSLRLAFHSTGYSGSTHDLVVWGTYICNCYFSSSYWDISLNKYVADKL